MLCLITFVGLVFNGWQFSVLGEQNQLLAGVTTLRGICWFTSVILKPCSWWEAQRLGWWQVLLSFLLPWAAHTPPTHTHSKQRCRCWLQFVSEQTVCRPHSSHWHDVRPPLSLSTSASCCSALSNSSSSVNWRKLQNGQYPQFREGKLLLVAEGRVCYTHSTVCVCVCDLLYVVGSKHCAKFANYIF